MKSIARPLMLCAIFLVTAFASQAQKLDEIIQKHIAAIGGEDAWKKITSMRMEGSVKAQGMEITIVKTVVQNKAMRQDISMMGMSGYTITTNKEGWSYMPFGGGQTAPEAMTPDMVKQGQSQLDIQGDFVDYKAKGTTVAFVGKDDVEGTEALKIVVTHKDSTVKTIYLDASTYLILREVDKYKADGKEMEVTVDYSNYQKQPNGIVFAMTIGVPQGEVNFTKLEVNTTIDDALFKPSK